MKEINNELADKKAAMETSHKEEEQQGETAKLGVGTCDKLVNCRNMVDKACWSLNSTDRLPEINAVADSLMIKWHALVYKLERFLSLQEDFEMSRKCFCLVEFVCQELGKIIKDATEDNVNPRNPSATELSPNVPTNISEKKSSTAQSNMWKMALFYEHSYCKSNTYQTDYTLYENVLRTEDSKLDRLECMNEALSSLLSKTEAELTRTGFPNRANDQTMNVCSTLPAVAISTNETEVSMVEMHKCLSDAIKSFLSKTGAKPSRAGLENRANGKAMDICTTLPAAVQPIVDAIPTNQLPANDFSTLRERKRDPKKVTPKPKKMERSLKIAQGNIKQGERERMNASRPRMSGFGNIEQPIAGSPSRIVHVSSVEIHCAAITKAKPQQKRKPKKRGRKPRRRPAPKVVTSENVVPAVGVQNSGAAVEVVIPKRKRGRPRKNPVGVQNQNLAIDQNNNTESIEKNEPTAGSPERKRTRASTRKYAIENSKLMRLTSEVAPSPIKVADSDYGDDSLLSFFFIEFNITPAVLSDLITEIDMDEIYNSFFEP